MSFFKRKKEVFLFPVTCQKIDLNQVPDAVFSQRLLGDGVAIVPQGSLITAPCDGEILQIFPTNHAIGILTPLGLELLIHIGIDTVELKGEGFKRLAEPGQKVRAGEPLVEVDLEYVASMGKPLETPIIITNMDKVLSIDAKDTQNLMSVTLK